MGDPLAGRYRPGVKQRCLAIALAAATSACGGAAGPARPVDATVPVLRVLDGDSLLVQVDGAEAEVRLLGINAPERGECYDEQARAETARLAADGVRLAGESEDRFGRLLRYAYAEDGTLINQELVAAGLALALTADHTLLDDFKAAEAKAFQARVGRWQADACGPAAGAELEISDLTYDAPGDDAQNANGEWIDILNRGSDVVSLTGWAVQDESSSHRFRFPDGFTLGPGERVRIASGCGTASDDRLFWCDADPVWNNGGDTAYLLDPSGNVADRYAFWL